MSVFGRFGLNCCCNPGGCPCDTDPHPAEVTLEISGVSGNETCDGYDCCQVLNNTWTLGEAWEHGDLPICGWGERFAQFGTSGRCTGEMSVFVDKTGTYGSNVFLVAIIRITPGFFTGCDIDKCEYVIYTHDSGSTADFPCSSMLDVPLTFHARGGPVGLCETPNMCGNMTGLTVLVSAV